MILGLWFLVLQVLMWSPENGSSGTNFILMALWRGIRHVGWFEDSHNRQEWTMEKLSAL
jgi:hypothetical protein